MAILLRKIRQSRWYSAIEDMDGPLPADPLADLNTARNTLSIWEVSPDESNISSIVVAIAATRNAVSNVDVALFDSAPLSRRGVTVHATEGQTPLADARSYHRDLIDLTAEDVLQIGELIRRRKTLRPFTENQVGQLLAEAVRTFRLSRSDLDENVIRHLEKRGLI